MVEIKSKQPIQKIKRGKVTYEVEEDKITSLEVLSHNEYIKKVNKKQMWNSIFNTLGESLGAMGAGYSTSTTTGQAQIYSNSFGFANGYVGSSYGSAYGSIYASSYSNTSINTSSTTNSYNGMNAYVAQQNVRANIVNYENQQNQIKQTLSDGYLKLNTIFNQTEYVGYVNIKYKKGDRLQMNIPINRSNYGFTWDFK